MAIVGKVGVPTCQKRGFRLQTLARYHGNASQSHPPQNDPGAKNRTLVITKAPNWESLQIFS